MFSRELLDLPLATKNGVTHSTLDVAYRVPLYLPAQSPDGKWRVVSFRSHSPWYPISD
jgi:hypothetical protein